MMRPDSILHVKRRLAYGHLGNLERLFFTAFTSLFFFGGAQLAASAHAP